MSECDFFLMEKKCLANINKRFMNLGAKATSASPKGVKERNTTRNLPKRSASSVGKSSTSGMGMRSVSVGMLNQAVRNYFWKFLILFETSFLFLGGLHLN
jgi:hypothetical protein